MINQKQGATGGRSHMTSAVLVFSAVIIMCTHAHGVATSGKGVVEVHELPRELQQSHQHARVLMQAPASTEDASAKPETKGPGAPKPTGPVLAELTIPDDASPDSESEAVTASTQISNHFSKYLSSHKEWLTRLAFIGKVPKVDVVDGCKNIAAGQGVFTVETVKLDESGEQVGDDGQEVEQAKVQHEFGCTYRKKNKLFLHSNLETRVIFGKFTLHGKEHLVDCYEGAQECSAFVLVTKEEASELADASIEKTSPGGRRLNQQGSVNVYNGPVQVTNNNCFPGTAMVQLSNGESIPVSRLQQGDRVKVVLPSGAVAYDEVYLWGHKDDGAVSHMVKLATMSNQTLRATKDHFLHVVPAAKAVHSTPSWKDVQHVSAGKVKAGDLLVRVGDGGLQFERIYEASTSVEKGLYNPYTMGGNIVVDGFSASSHSNMIGMDTLVGEGPHAPRVYQAVLAPVRLAYRLFPRLLKVVDDRYSAQGWETAGIMSIMRDIKMFYFQAVS